MLITYFVITIALVITSNLLMLNQLTHEISHYLIAYALWLLPLFTLLNLTQAFLQGPRFSLAPIKIYQLAIYLIAGLLGLYLLDEDRYLNSTTASILISLITAITLFIQFWQLRHHSKQTFIKGPIEKKAPSTLIAILSFTTLSQFGIVMVCLILSERAAGLYAAAASITLLVDIPRATSTAYSAKLVTNLYQEGNHQELQKLIDKIARINFWPTLILLGLVFIFGDPLLKLFGNPFTTAYPALCLLAVVQAWYGFNHISIQLMNLTIKPTTSLLTYGIFFITFIILAYPLLKLEGLIGAPIALLLTQFGLRLWASSIIKKKPEIKYLSLPSSKLIKNIETLT